MLFGVTQKQKYTQAFVANQCGIDNINSCQMPVDNNNNNKCLHAKQRIDAAHYTQIDSEANTINKTMKCVISFTFIIT